MIGADESDSIINETETSPTDQGVLDDELDYQLVSINSHVQNCIPIGRGYVHIICVDKNRLCTNYDGVILYTGYRRW